MSFGKSRYIDARNYDKQCSDWLVARYNEIILNIKYKLEQAGGD